MGIEAHFPIQSCFFFFKDLVCFLGSERAQVGGGTEEDNLKEGKKGRRISISRRGKKGRRRVGGDKR